MPGDTKRNSRSAFDNENESDFSSEPVAKKPRKAAAPRSSKKAAAKDAGTCSVTKKEFGDRVKAALALEK